MKNWYISLLLLALGGNTATSGHIHAQGPSINKSVSPYVITFFIKPYPTLLKTSSSKNAPSEKVQQVIANPGEINRTFIKQQATHHIYQGIYIVYSGFVTYSDSNGQIVLPRKHPGETITMVVTQRIDPVIVRGNTVQYFVRDPDSPIAFYKIQRIKNPVTQEAAWHIEKQPVPTDNKIPFDAIVIIAQPEHIIIPEGTVETDSSQNLRAPNVYVTKNMSTALSTLSFLRVSRFFAPLRRVYQYGLKRYAFLLKP
jgi:hypothetical protein